MGDISEEHEDRIGEFCEWCGELYDRCYCDDFKWEEIQDDHENRFDLDFDTEDDE